MAVDVTFVSPLFDISPASDSFPSTVYIFTKLLFWRIISTVGRLLTHLGIFIFWVTERSYHGTELLDFSGVLAQAVSRHPLLALEL